MFPACVTEQIQLTFLSQRLKENIIWVLYFQITQYHLRLVQLPCIYQSIFAVAAAVVLLIKLCEIPKYGQLGFILISTLGFSVDQIGVNISLQKSRPIIFQKPFQCVWNLV